VDSVREIQRLRRRVRVGAPDRPPVWGWTSMLTLDERDDASTKPA
jgi:hypothetical protein